ncbi:unnamed protein product [Caenorhabditis nigoni]
MLFSIKYSSSFQPGLLIFVLIMEALPSRSSDSEDSANGCLRSSVFLIDGEYSKEALSLATGVLSNLQSCESQVKCLQDLVTTLTQSTVSDAPKLAKEVANAFAPCLAHLEPIPSIFGL